MFRKFLCVLCVLCFASIAVATDYPPDFTGMTPSYEVTGSEYIDINGLYFENGTYLDNSVYQSSSAPYAWLWLSDEPTWVLSLYPGNWSMWVWKNYDAEPNGTYFPQFYSQGQCTVSSVPEPGCLIGLISGASLFFLYIRGMKGK